MLNEIIHLCAYYHWWKGFQIVCIHSGDPLELDDLKNK